MPSLIRLLFVLGMLSGLAYGGIVSLATFVQPQPREMSVTIPQDRLNKHR
ncbi:MAG TPA: histidine kinase [Xanthobacteraceae bacterium]|nr:histidine kinase [Xanthobacteraceae bacterium]